ncbi:MAG: peptidylprolyl isomerase [Candidatus Zixiibacteriota bacterium]
MRKTLWAVFLSILMILLRTNLAASAPPAKAVSREEVLAKVNGDPVTVGRFLDFMKESKTTSGKPEENQKTKEDALHELIRRILISQKAARLDLDSDSVFVKSRNLHMQGYILDQMHQKDIADKIVVGDEEVRSHYQEVKDQDFVIPEKVQVRDLLIRVWADSTQKNYKKNLKRADKEAKRKIEELYPRAVAGEDFADLCRHYSQGVVPDASGNLGFIQRGQYSPEFDSAAFSLKETKQVSRPVRDQRGYHLIQLLDRKEKSYQVLDSTLFEGIRQFLKDRKTQEATRNFVDSLKSTVEFVYNRDVLNSNESSFDKNLWVLAFGEKDTVRFGEYETALGGYRVDMGLDTLTTEDKKDILVNYMALPVILEGEARKRGYADWVEYKAEKRSFELEEAEKRVLAERIKEDFPPASMEEMEAYYQAHKIDLPALGVPIHVYHIVFDDSLKAVEVLNQIRNGADFVELAKKYFPGESEIKDVAYDLGFISQGEMPDEFYQAALNLKEGEVSQPVKTTWGYHLIKVVERKEKGTSLADLSPQIQRAISLEKARKHLADWDKNLFEQANLWINRPLLRRIVLPKPEV